MIDQLSERLAGLDERYEALTQRMAEPEVAADYEKLQTLAKERASLERVVELYRGYKRAAQELAEAKALAGGEGR